MDRIGYAVLFFLLAFLSLCAGIQAPERIHGAICIALAMVLTGFGLALLSLETRGARS